MSALVLSIDQPYASLIMLGHKRFETRPAPPNGNMRPDGVRGLPGAKVNRGDQLLIASTSRKPLAVGDWVNPHMAYGDWCVQRDTTKPGDLFASHSTLGLPLGCILGSVTVTDAYPIDTGEDDEHQRHIFEWGDSLNLCMGDGRISDISDQLPVGDWTPGRWAWALTDPEPLPEPIPVTGKQGVWRWDGAS